MYVPELAVSGELIMFALNGSGIGTGMLFAGRASVAVNVVVFNGKVQLLRVKLPLPLAATVTTTVAVHFSSIPSASNAKGTPLYVNDDPLYEFTVVRLAVPVIDTPFSPTGSSSMVVTATELPVQLVAVPPEITLAVVGAVV